MMKVLIDREEAAHLAEITIVTTMGSKSAEEVVELLARQRQMIADRIRGMNNEQV